MSQVTPHPELRMTAAIKANTPEKARIEISMMNVIILFLKNNVCYNIFRLNKLIINLV